jgi:hypothetical protein
VMGQEAARSQLADRAAAERAVHKLVLDVAGRAALTGVSIVVQGAPGIGKTFLAHKLLGSVPNGAAKVVSVVGEQGRRNDPFAGAAPLLEGLAGGADPSDAAFDRVDELCADGPVVLRVAVSHPDRDHLLQAQVIAEVSREILQHCQLGGFRVPEPASEPMGAEQVQDCVRTASRTHTMTVSPQLPVWAVVSVSGFILQKLGTPGSACISPMADRCDSQDEDSAGRPTGPYRARLPSLPVPPNG